ncbi:MAG: hypothetical protein JKY40_02875 [Gammaproteobacteria bacterium]|nr:hypothetical protein [Gammaproteobacteria bacterium]
MTVQKLLFSLLLTSFLASCAGSDAGSRPRLPTDAEVVYYNSIAPEEEHIACFTRIELGSRFPRRSCYRVADLEASEGLEQNIFDLMKIEGLINNPLGF